MRPKGVTLAIVAALTLLGVRADAVGTRTFELNTLEKLSGGDLKGVGVSSDGTVRAGWTLGNVSLQDATAVWSAIPLGDGSTLVGTSPEGKVFKVVGDQATVFANTGALAVTSLVQGANGVIYAATLPDGKIFRLTQGQAQLFATLPDANSVWALALDKSKSALYAATGPEGKVFRVDANGASSVYFKSDETNLVSLAVADSGEVYAGSSGKGLLYRISGPGHATVLFDFPGEPVVSVRAIATAKGGVVYAIANEESEAPEPPKRNGSSGRTPAAAATAPHPKPGKGSLYRFDASGRPERMMHHDEFHYMALTLDEKGQPYVGTGAEGRVYTVDDAHVVTLIADTDERQVGALLATTNGGFVATSDPATLHRIVGRGGADAIWTSKVLDAGLRARFGVLTWRARGTIELSTRTGDTLTPDSTWTAWSSPLSTSGPITSPPGRFLQVRGRWSRDPNAVLSDVEIPFVTENVRPIVLEIAAQTKTASAAPHETKDGVPASGGEVPKHDSVLKVTWKVDDPDNDQLRYRITFRREGQNVWRDVLRPDEVLTKSEVEWDTQALPEGKYRLRVEASDELANPPDLVQKNTLESPLVVVDNTPPVFNTLTLGGRRLRARVIDGIGPIARVEIAVDGRLEWRPLAPADGIFDSADEAVDSDVSSIVPPGPHIVAIRAFDAAGNAVVQDIESL